MSNIEFIDLKSQQAKIKPQLDEAIQKVLSHGQYVLGPEVTALEQMLSTYTNAKRVITCANGTDALQLVLMTKNLQPDDVVFVPTFTFAATAEVVALTQAVPFFVDVNPHTFNICPHSLKSAIVEAKKQNLNPAGVIAVDLFGLPADYIALEEIAHDEGLWLISDAAQSFGSSLRGNKMGTLAPVTTTSFFPAKPLGCYGDGGAIFIRDNDELVDKLLSLRNHGAGTHRYDHINIGINSRLDTLQAAILIEKLKVFDWELEQKQRLANFYNENLPSWCEVQNIPDYYRSALAIYTFKCDASKRESIKAYLQDANIPAPVYYHMPLHRQAAYECFPKTQLPNAELLCKQVLSLPMHAYLALEQRQHLIDKITVFVG